MTISVQEAIKHKGTGFADASSRFGTGIWRNWSWSCHCYCHCHCHSAADIPPHSITPTVLRTPTPTTYGQLSCTELPHYVFLGTSPTRSNQPIAALLCVLCARFSHSHSHSNSRSHSHPPLVPSTTARNLLPSAPNTYYFDIHIQTITSLQSPQSLYLRYFKVCVCPFPHQNLPQNLIPSETLSTSSTSASPHPPFASLRSTGAVSRVQSSVTPFRHDT